MICTLRDLKFSWAPTPTPPPPKKKKQQEEKNNTSHNAFIALFRLWIKGDVENASVIHEPIWKIGNNIKGNVANPPRMAVSFF